MTLLQEKSTSENHQGKFVLLWCLQPTLSSTFLAGWFVQSAASLKRTSTCPLILFSFSSSRSGPIAKHFQRAEGNDESSRYRSRRHPQFLPNLPTIHAAVHAGDGSGAWTEWPHQSSSRYLTEQEEEPWETDADHLWWGVVNRHLEGRRICVFEVFLPLSSPAAFNWITLCCWTKEWRRLVLVLSWLSREDPT